MTDIYMMQQNKVQLKPGERIDDLQRNGCHIIQNSEKFSFGMDAVLLSGFAAVKAGERVLDMGTGTGIIPVLLEAKTEGEHFTGLEIQKESADMARRSVLLNGQEKKISVVEGDIKEAVRLFGASSFDVVTVNPPYMPAGGGMVNPDAPKAIARHEILCTLEDVVREGAGVLREGGRMYMVHRPRRLAELMETMKKYRMEPKRMKFVHSFANKEANMVLMEAVKGGGRQLIVEAPVIIFKSHGVYLEEIKEKYGF